MSSELQIVSEIEIVPFKEQILRFDEIERSQKRMFHTIKDTRSYFWKQFKMNRKKFDRLFIALLREKYRNPSFALHGNVVGSVRQKDFIELPIDVCPYKARTIDTMFFSLWSTEEADGQ